MLSFLLLIAQRIVSDSYSHNVIDPFLLALKNRSNTLLLFAFTSNAVSLATCVLSPFYY